MLNRIEFILEEAIVALRRNGMMTVAAISTSAIALLIFGGLGYAYISLMAFLGTLQSEFELRVSIDGDLPPWQKHKMAEELRAIPGVESVVLLPKEVEWKKFLEKQKLDKFYADQPNPFRDQFQVQLSRLEDADAVKAALLEHPKVHKTDGVRDARREREFAIALMKLIRLIGGLLSLVSFVTAGTLIYNTVHLTVMARRNELRIMSLVGASHSTIRWPMLLEGGIQGAIGGLFAGLSLWALVVYMASRSIGWLGLDKAVDPEFPATAAIASLAAVGAVLGILSAGLSVRRYLKLRA